VEVFIPDVELVFVLSSGAIEAWAGSEVPEDGGGSVENTLLSDEIDWIILFVDLIEFELDACKVSSDNDLKGLGTEMSGIVKFFGCH
jgi:hypothetical protein